MIIRRFLVSLKSASGQRPKVLVLKFGIECRRFVAQSLQRKLHSTSPFAEARFRIGKHPRDAIDRWKIDLACRAMVANVFLIER